MLHVSSWLATLQGRLRTVLCCFGTLLTRGALACGLSPPTLGHLLGLAAAAEQGRLRGPRPRQTAAGRQDVAVAGASSATARALALAGAGRALGVGARLAAVRGHATAAVFGSRVACGGSAATCVGLKR